MKYIQSIQLKNFQSHIDSTLNFSSGLNVIVGPSDSGKTSVIRAIKWVLYDEPQGDAVLRTGTDEVYVKIEMSDGSWIEKSRKKKKTLYVLYDILTSKKETFQGSRGDVKQRVGAILGMRFDEDGGKASYNLQEQLAAPFLLSDGGPTKAAAIGQLIGLDIIDEATQGTRSDITSKKQQINRILKEESRLDEILRQYEGLEKTEIQLNKTENLLSRISQRQNSMERAMELSAIAEQLFSQIGDVKNDLNKYQTLEECIKIHERIRSLSEAYHFQVQLLQKKQMLEVSIEKNLQILSNTEEVEKAQDKKEKLEKNLERYFGMLNFNLFMKKINREIASVEKVLSKTVNMEQCQTVSEMIQSKKDQWEHLKMHLCSITKIKTLWKEAVKNNEKFSAMDHSLELQKQLEDDVALYLLIKKTSEKIKDIHSRLTKGHRYLSERNEDIRSKTLEYRQLWSSEKRCPTCHRPLSEHEIRQIIGEVEE